MGRMTPNQRLTFARMFAKELFLLEVPIRGSDPAERLKTLGADLDTYVLDPWSQGLKSCFARYDVNFKAALTRVHDSYVKLLEEQNNLVDDCLGKLLEGVQLRFPKGQELLGTVRSLGGSDKEKTYGQVFLFEDICQSFRTAMLVRVHRQADKLYQDVWGPLETNLVDLLGSSNSSLPENKKGPIKEKMVEALCRVSSSLKPLDQSYVFTQTHNETDQEDLKKLQEVLENVYRMNSLPKHEITARHLYRHFWLA